MKRIAVFYLSKNGRGWPVRVGERRFPPNVAFVRAEFSSAKTLEDALDQAKPRRGEIVMNSHYVKVPV